MAAPYKANIVLAYTNNWLLQGGVSNDMLIVTTNSNQSILFGSSNTSNLFMKISSNGFIGIATSNPTFPLDVTGDVNFTGILRQGGVAYIGSQWSNNTSNLFIFGSNVGMNVSNVSEGFELQTKNAKFGCNLYVLSNVGIGTSNPSFPLDVTGTSRLGTTTYLDSGNNTGCMRLSVGTNATYIESGLTNVTNSAAPLLFRNINGGIEYMRITNVGYVGIGTTSPLFPLDVIGTSKVGSTMIVDSGNNTGCMRLSVGTNATYIESGLTNVTNSAAPILFRNIQGGTEYMRIASNGCVGVGNANPVVSLDVTGSARVGSLTVGTIVRMPPIPLPYSSTRTYTLTGQTYGNGVYTALASSENADGNQRASGIWTIAGPQGFNLNWASGTAPAVSVGNVLQPTLTTDNRIVSGEWVQINIPLGLSVTNYTFAGKLFTFGSANTFYLLGSTNGTVWILLDTQSGITNWITNIPQTFNVSASSTQYTYFRLQIYETNPGTGSYTTISTIMLNGFYVSGYLAGGVSVGVPMSLPFPPISMPASATATLTGQVYGNGLYSISASSAYGGSESAYNGWAYSLSTFGLRYGYTWTASTPSYNTSGIYTGSYSTVVSGIAIFGEYLTISLPQAIICSGYMIYGSTAYVRGPVNFTIAGSADGVTWFLVDSKTSITTWSASTPNYVSTLVSIIPYSYYRIIVQTVGTSAGIPTLGFRVNGYVPTLIYPLNVVGNSRIQGAALIGGLAGPSSVFPALPYPPIGLRAEYTTVLSGQPYGNGVYSCASTLSTTYQPSYSGWNYGTLTQTTRNMWSPNIGYNATGLYNGTSSTIVSGNPVFGEWLQITMPQLIACTGYTVYGCTNYPGNSPASFVVAGSTNGILWYTIDSISGITSYSARAPNYVGILLATAIPYTFFRIIVKTVQNTGGGSATTLRFQVMGMPVNTTITSQGALGIGTTNPQYPLDVTGNANFSGNISAGNIGMFRNRIINGDMRIAQRGTTATLSVDQSQNYLIDRTYVYVYYADNGILTISQTQLTANELPYKQGYTQSLKVLVTIANANMLAFIGQNIEGNNLSDLMWGTSFGSPIVLSFWIVSNVANGTLMNAVIKNAINKTIAYCVPYTYVTSGVWQFVTLSISAPPAGTWAIGSDMMVLPYSTWKDSMTGVANTWRSGNIYGFPDVSLTTFRVAGNYVQITGLQVEKGTLVTPFEFRPYAIESQLCQRYFECYSGSLFGLAYSTTSIMALFNPSVRKRTPITPATLSLSSAFGFSVPGYSVYTQSTPTITTWNASTTANDGTNVCLQFNNFSGLTTNQMYMKPILNVNSSVIYINTELTI